MPIQATRALLHAALAGELDEVDYRVDEVFGFEVPVARPGVEPSLLDPRSTWRDPGRPALPRHHERVRVHGRRHVDGAPRGAAAEGHRVHAVPPDDDVPERDPDHRGLPRARVAT